MFGGNYRRISRYMNRWIHKRSLHLLTSKKIYKHTEKTAELSMMQLVCLRNLIYNPPRICDNNNHN